MRYGGAARRGIPGGAGVGAQCGLLIGPAASGLVDTVFPVSNRVSHWCPSRIQVNRVNSPDAWLSLWQVIVTPHGLVSTHVERYFLGDR